MTGKQKCKILKEIRRQIAAQNDIRFVIEECTHKGSCRGTCPKCEWEVRMLEKELEKRRASGKKVALADISAGFLLSSCAPIDALKELIHPVVQPLEGDVAFEVTAADELSQQILLEDGDRAGDEARTFLIDRDQVLRQHEVAGAQGRGDAA